MNDPRLDLVDASRSFQAVIGSIGPDDWDRPGLGEWNVRELVAHTARAFVTIEDYVGGSGEVTIHSPAEYYGTIVVLPGIHTAVAERGHLAGAQIGDDPVAAVNELITRVLALVDATPLESVLDVRGGTMTLATYLPTRVLELVVHTDDLCRALDRQPEASANAVRSCAQILSGMLRPEHITVVRALLGRGSLDGIDLLAGP
jgi:uncharacterized protein (TIGR03083 family)